MYLIYIYLEHQRFLVTYEVPLLSPSMCLKHLNKSGPTFSYAAFQVLLPNISATHPVPIYHLSFSYPIQLANIPSPHVPLPVLQADYCGISSLLKFFQWMLCSFLFLFPSFLSFTDKLFSHILNFYLLIFSLTSFSCAFINFIPSSLSLLNYLRTYWWLSAGYDF